MNKDEYRSAIAKIKASDKFKEKAEATMKASSTGVNSFKTKRLAASLAALLVVALIGAIPALKPVKLNMRSLSVKSSAQLPLI